MAKKSYRMVLIDPIERNIRELESEVTLDAIHKLIGADTLDSFRLALFDNRRTDMGWIDDAGLSRGKPVHAFLLPTAKDPIAGKCLIIGADDRGETCSCQIPIEVLRQDVSWLGLILPEVTWDETGAVSRAIVTYSRMKT